MTRFTMVAGWTLIGFASLVFCLKLPVARSRCSGGAPLLDGVVIPPIVAVTGTWLLTGSAAAFGLVLPFALFVSVAYWIAWRLPRRSK